METRDQLKDLRRKLTDQYLWFQLAALTYTIIFLIMAGIACSMLVLLHPSSPWLIPEPPDELMDQVSIWVLAVAGGLAVFGFLPYLVFIYNDQYDRIRDRLVNGSLGEVLIDPVYWEPVTDQANHSKWLASTGLRQPRTLPEQIELAADYHRYLMARSRGLTASFTGAIQQGNRSRMADNIAAFTFNMSCLGIGLMTFGAPVLVLFFPVSFWLIFTYAKQRASKAAMLDFFIRSVQHTTRSG